MTTKSDVEKFLTQLFLNKESPVQYGAPTAVYKHIRKHYPKAKVSFERVKSFIFKNSRANQIVQRVNTRKFKRLPYRAWGYNHQWQADLVDFGFGKKFILTCIDLFERWNQILQRMLQKIKYNEPKTNIHHALKRVVSQYNKQENPAMGNIAPEKINYENSGYLLSRSMGQMEAQAKQTEKVVTPFLFTLGQYVRSTERVGTFHKKSPA